MIKQIRPIVQGRVFCAVRKLDVDIEECLVCRRLDEIDVDSRRPHVVCRLEPEDIERSG